MLPNTSTVAESHKSAAMARSAKFTVDEMLEMLLGEGLQEIDSGDESDIEEDPEFPLPHEPDEESDNGSSSSEGM